MDAKDLKGRELAAWLRGRASMATHYERQPCAVSDVAYGMVLAAAEIERLCAEKARSDNTLIPVWAMTKEAVEQAAHDAAALDEIATMIERSSSGHDHWSPVAWTGGYTCIQTRLFDIIERTGRKIGGGK